MREMPVQKCPECEKDYKLEELRELHGYLSPVDIFGCCSSGCLKSRIARAKQIEHLKYKAAKQGKKTISLIDIMKKAKTCFLPNHESPVELSVVEKETVVDDGRILEGFYLNYNPDDDVYLRIGFQFNSKITEMNNPFEFHTEMDLITGVEQMTSHLS